MLNLYRKSVISLTKTHFIEKLEAIKNPVFLRPRRFGKSLFCSMLQYYYDIREASRFEELFGTTWIGKSPTPSHNSFIVLKLDFSELSSSDTKNQLEQNFNHYCNCRLIGTATLYSDYLPNMPDIRIDDPASLNLSTWLGHVRASGAPRSM